MYTKSSGCYLWECPTALSRVPNFVGARLLDIEFKVSVLHNRDGLIRCMLHVVVLVLWSANSYQVASLVSRRNSTCD